MRRMTVVGARFLAFGIVFVGVLGLSIMFLWNLLLPSILHLPEINYWQALGLFLLSRMLFGRFGGWGSRMRRARFARGWGSLTPEEQQRFQNALGGCRPGRTES